jgi:hypothetical protein
MRVDEQLVPRGGTRGVCKGHAHLRAQPRDMFVLTQSLQEGSVHGARWRKRGRSLGVWGMWGRACDSQHPLLFMRLRFVHSNQWIVLDYNLILGQPGDQLLPNTLVIAEQVPGM